MRNVEVGTVLPTFTRTTGFQNWNRYAAVNDEFIDVHMSADDARAAGQPDVFGMGNLRIAYVHAMLHDWLSTDGMITAFACQFRGFNFLGDELTAHATVTSVVDVAQGRLVDLAVGVRNQHGDETMPGSAQVLLFSGRPALLPAPAPPAVPRREPGVHLDAKTIGWLGTPIDPVDSYAIDANDIRRWAQTAWFPDGPAPEFLEVDIAKRGPWGGMVALADFNPFAWNPRYRPDIYPWMRGMGTEPGTRGLNGGQRSWYFAPLRLGDVITAHVQLVDAYEKDGRLGTMMFLIDETRFVNQRGELVRIGLRTSIYH